MYFNMGRNIWMESYFWEDMKFCGLGEIVFFGVINGLIHFRPYVVRKIEGNY